MCKYCSRPHAVKIKISCPWTFTMICNVTPPHAPTRIHPLLTIRFLAGRWSTSGLRGLTHISCHYKNTIGGTGENKTNEQTRTMLGINSEQKENMQHYMHVQTNASVGYKRKFHKATGMPTSLDLIFFAGPYLLCNCLRSRPHLSVVPRQPPVSSFLQPTLFRVPLPLPDTARFQVQKSFVWFRAKTDKGIVYLAGHLYSVTNYEKR